MPRQAAGFPETEPEDEARPPVALVCSLVAVLCGGLGGAAWIIGGGGTWLTLPVFVLFHGATFCICISIYIFVDMRRGRMQRKPDSTASGDQMVRQTKNYQSDNQPEKAKDFRSNIGIPDGLR